MFGAVPKTETKGPPQVFVPNLDTHPACERTPSFSNRTSGWGFMGDGPMVARTTVESNLAIPVWGIFEVRDFHRRVLFRCSRAPVPRSRRCSSDITRPRLGAQEGRRGPRHSPVPIGETRGTQNIPEVSHFLIPGLSHEPLE